ncbi:hypothetical protein ILUMI_24023 [Ignelater luminosus]|uniref:DUF1758 domain-containing protein n=1 Tax=Ignelater luminosus TaxID=2038154 RepID=A0A8K0CDE3_IGNLU|nr:hypothetical protein ILUMI_24023 [Ignelater luminosus]
MHKEQSNLVNEHHAQIGGESNKCERILQTTLQQSLPRLSLPTFHGNFIDYLPFIDNFKSMVDRANISNSQNFFHLLSCVKEGAKEVIAGLLPSDENYDVALALLETRYNKPKLIIQAHIKNIFDLKPVTKSASSLREFTDNLNKNVSCLHNMKLTDSQIAGALFSYVVSNKLDSETKEKFKMSNPNEIPSIDNTVTFLQNRVQLLLDIHADNTLERNFQSRFNGAKVKVNVNNQNKRVVLLANEQKQIKCILCSGSHHLPDCSDFKQLSIEQRIKKVRELKTCKNCLKHPSKYNCKLYARCSHCKNFHHDLLHLSNASNESQGLSIINNDAPSNNVHAERNECNDRSSVSLTLLATAQVAVKNNQGETFNVRALLVSGSTNNLITKRLANKLNLKQDAIEVNVAGVNLNKIKLTNSVNISINSLCSNYSRTINCFIIEKITSLVPAISFNKQNLRIPPHIQLADSKFNEASEIDILIGASYFYEIIGNNRISMGRHLPILIESKFGYVLTGDMSPQVLSLNKTLPAFVHCCVGELTLNNNLSKLWELDNVRPKDQISLLSEEERNAKFILGETLEKIKTRIKEYENLKHMTKININPSELNKYYFLPHHPVLRADSITTKLRIVFDGSAKTTTGLSINDCQKNGPVVQNDLFSILIQFREHSVAIIADCEKLYRQILVSPEDRRYQTILWRDNLNEMVSAYSLNTVTYGCKSSSYLSTRCLKQLAEECKESNKSVSELINKSLYVDDLIYSGVDAVSVKNLMCETMKVFGSAGIPLRKFISNVPAALPKPGQINVEYFTINLKETETTKALRLQWVPQPDVLKYSFEFNAAQDTITKRFILSTIARVFDSIGLISPILVKGKILMQKLWQDKLGWDDPIIDESSKQYWESLLQDLHVTYDERDSEMKVTKQITVCQTDNDVFDTLVNRFSKLLRLQKVFAFILRISERAKNKEVRFNQVLTSEELETALLKLVKICHIRCFNNEIKDLMAGHNVSRSSKLKAFLDANEMLCVGGRIKNSDLNYDQIHPFVLSQRHALTLLIIKYYYAKNLHCGSDHLLSVIREK